MAPSLAKRPPKKRWKTLTRWETITTHHLTIGEKMAIFDNTVRFRGAALGPMTRQVQELYDNALDEFFEELPGYAMHIPHGHRDQDREDQTKQDALSWALSTWLDNAIPHEEPEIVLAPSDFPNTFVGLMELMTRGQSTRVKRRLAFLTSEEPLLALAS